MRSWAQRLAAALLIGRTVYKSNDKQADGEAPGNGPVIQLHAHERCTCQQGAQGSRCAAPSGRYSAAPKLSSSCIQVRRLTFSESLPRLSYTYDISRVRLQVARTASGHRRLSRRSGVKAFTKAPRGLEGDTVSSWQGCGANADDDHRLRGKFWKHTLRTGRFRRRAACTAIGRAHHLQALRYRSRRRRVVDRTKSDPNRLQIERMF